MTPALAGWRDVAGLIGVFLVALGAVAGLSWPSYTDRDFASPADRREAARHLREHEHLRQTKGT